MVSCFSYLGKFRNIFQAVERGDLEMVGWLLSHGFSANVHDKDSFFFETPLHVAARNNNTEVAQLLITHKADIEARDRFNQTPLH